MHKLFLILFLIGMMMSVLPTAADAQEEALDLSRLIQTMLESSPALKAARAETEAARFRINQAAALPDPQVGVAVMGADIMTMNGPQEDMYEFEQMIPFPGKLIQQKKIAAAEAEVAAAKSKAMERELIQRVSETYYELWMVDKTLVLLEESKNLLQRVEEITQSRYATRAVSQKDVSRAQSELAGLLEQIFMARQKKETLQASLNAIVGRPVEVMFPDESMMTDYSLPPLESLILEIDATNPELKAAKSQQLRQKHELSLSRYDNAPDFSLGFQYTKIGAGETNSMDDGKDAWMIPIKVTLPLWRTKVGNRINEAKSNLEASQRGLEEIRNQTEFALKESYYRYQAKKQTAELYRTALLPQAETAYKSDQAGYEAGSVDIIMLMESERMFLNTKMAYYETLFEMHKSISMIERNLGRSVDAKGGE